MNNGKINDAIKARKAAIDRILAAHKAEWDAIYDEERVARDLPKMADMSQHRVSTATTYLTNRLSVDERRTLARQLLLDED